MTKNNKLYNTQFLKSWSQNANRELYLADQSMLETSYSINEETDSSHDELYNNFNNNIEDGSWINLNNDNKDPRIPIIDDGSLTTILCELSSNQQRRRKSSISTTTGTSITAVNPEMNLNKFSNNLIESNTTSNSSSSVSLNLNKKKKRKGNHGNDNNLTNRKTDNNMSNLLFQITCLSIIIASFSFSLGFMFGAKNGSRLRYF